MTPCQQLCFPRYGGLCSRTQRISANDSHGLTSGTHIDALEPPFAFKMTLDRVEGEGETRCVFKEGCEDLNGPTWLDKKERSKHISRKYSRWAQNLPFYRGRDQGATDEGGNFDATPYILWIHGAAMTPSCPDSGTIGRPRSSVSNGKAWLKPFAKSKPSSAAANARS